jgi:hypothetical protein
MRKLLSILALGVLFAASTQAQTAATSSVSTNAPVNAPAATTPANAPAAAAAAEATPAQPASLAPNSVTPAAVADSPADASVMSVAAERARPVSVPRFAKPVVVDGQLNEEVWKSAAVLKGFFQTQPGDNIAPSRQTEVLLGYDSTHLYVAFRAYDEPDKVRATVAKRDAIFDDDFVGMYLDTFNDQRRAYAFFFNPLGVQADGILTEGRGEDYSVDVVMESKGAMSEKGYTVEVMIPFKSVRYESGKSKLWGVHFFRTIKRFNNEVNSWMPLSRDRTGSLNQAGHITGLDEISTGRTLEIIPSFTLSETGRRVRTIPRSVVRAQPGLLDPGRLLNEPIHFEPGLTAKVGIASNITLDLAINPDFAQIEADQTVVTANQRFPIFFEEKRPFFLEGIDIFQTRLNVLHTRAIIDPDVAVKLSGKRGRNTFGVLLASDNAPGNFNNEERLDPVNLPFVDRNAQVGVLRLKRDFGGESNLGLMATTYRFVDRHNEVGGLDGRFRLDPTTFLDFQVVGTNSRIPIFDFDRNANVSRNVRGLGYAYQYDKTSRHLNFNLRGDGRSKFYRAAVGFTQRVNTNSERLFIRYASEPNPKAKLVSWFVSNSVPVSFDWQGRLQNWNDEARVGFNLQRQTSLALVFNGGYERVFEEEFGAPRSATRAGAFIGEDSERSTYKKTAGFIFSTRPSKKYAGSLQVFATRGSFDFDFGAGYRFPRVSPGALLNPRAPLDPGPGNSLTVQGSFVYQPIDKLRASLDYTKSRQTRYDTGRTAFDVNIYALRTTYQFSRFAFLRARVDFTTLPQRMRGQFLFGWTPNPGTAFYAGYNDDMFRNELNPYTGQLEPGFRRNGRTFFVKMSYLFRRTF